MAAAMWTVVGLVYVVGYLLFPLGYGGPFKGARASR